MSLKLPIVGKKRLSVGLALLAALLVALTGLMAVSAVHDLGVVELDGNVVDDLAAGTDWGAMYDPVNTPSTGELVNTPSGTVDSVFTKDFVIDASGPDPSYHEPSNKDDQAILASGGSSVWGCRPVANPTDKDDILNAMAVAVDASTSSGTHRILYVAGDRFDNSGTAFLGAWFFQKKVACDPATGKFVNAKDATQPGKTDGDILILANFSAGGKPANITLTAYRWSPGATPDAAGTFTVITPGARCSQLDPGDELCGEVNFGDLPTNGTFTSVWPFQDKNTPTGTTNGTVKLAEFFESGLDLTAGLGLPPGTPPPCFSTFMLETRSSDSLTATLKDYAAGSFETCGSTKAIKYHDLNANGSQDPGEPFLSDWTIFIDKNGNQTLDPGETSKITDANGEALFSDLQPGTYSFCEVLQDKWINSDPDSGTLCKSVNVVVDPPTEVKFGNYQNATKSGVKYHDLNADGSRDADGPDNIAGNADDEVGLEGWTITATATGGGGVTASTTTGADGSYTLSLHPGSYNVGETCLGNPGAKWRQSQPGPETDVAGCGSNKYAETLTSGQVKSGNDFGNFKFATKSGVKYHDLNANGSRDADGPDNIPGNADDEVGLASWTITATATGGGGVTDSTTTAADGSYSLSLHPGSYSVGETCLGNPAAGWRQSQPGPETDVAGCGNNKYPETLTSGQVKSGNDFGNFKNATKAGYKWRDDNGNGTQDGAEPRLSGWTISLTGKDGQGNDVSLTDTTDANGDYSFDVMPGTYTVCETLKTGWQQTFPTSGADCGGSLGYSITLTSGQVDNDNNFGNRQLYKLIVITCNTVTETLVDSTVTMNGVDTQTITTPPAGITEAQLCGLGGASYDNLPQGIYNLIAELPDLFPFFP